MFRRTLNRTLETAGFTLVLGVLCLTPAAIAKSKIESRWLDREIVVDGEIDEWRDALTFVRSVDSFVAMFNDDEFLYLCLYSQSSENASQFAIHGLRVRMEGDSGSFEVHYPRGSGEASATSGVPRVSGESVVELRVAGQRDPVAVAAGGEAGIEAGVSLRGSFVYELKLPLVASDSRPWAPGLAAGERFKLVIENPQLDDFDDQAPRPRSRHRDPTSPGGQTAPGAIGRTDDPGWGDSIDRDDPFFSNRFVFLLKARVDLAKRP